jgi:hypothetical protein
MHKNTMTQTLSVRMTERIRCRKFGKCRTIDDALRHFAFISNSSALHVVCVDESPMVVIRFILLSAEAYHLRKTDDGVLEGEAVTQRLRAADRDIWAWNGVFGDAKTAGGPCPRFATLHLAKSNSARLLGESIP